jgi:hypothetical protein
LLLPAGGLEGKAGLQLLDFFACGGRGTDILDQVVQLDEELIAATDL